ncbi:acyl-CoA oxidase [Daedaleopsis nitida]|nr:acyl-CoA oxidase [Daedaleopsis nitida]
MVVIQNVNDMKHAREQSTLAMDKLHVFLWGEREWEEKQRIESTLSQDATFDKSRKPFLTRTQLYNRGLAIMNRLHELGELHHWSHEESNMAFKILDEGVPIALHMAAFEPVIRSQGSPELKEKYSELIAQRGILGCYLQTELAHGTNVSALETTATYIPSTREFEIHSPTVTSSKWWIGALGKTATHGVVQARLILPNGRDVGPHLFFVQLRSLDDHMVLPGITIGDIGPKAMAGYAAIDNGFARFDHVRIPREQMLSAFASVTPDGQYVQPPHAKLSYGGMLYIRSTMVASAGWTIAKAATIAIRYTTIRRQGTKGPDGLERQVIGYPSVYYRLLPALAHAYVFIILGRNLTTAFGELLNRLASGDTSLLAEMHATTSGLKVLVSTTAIQDLETARRAMGGHGYSEFAGVGRIYADYVPAATYEGDNFVLDQQVVRAALKAFDAFVVGKTRPATSLTPSTAYLRHLAAPAPSTPSSPRADLALDWTDPQTAITLLERRAGRMVQDRARAGLDGPDASADQRVSRAVTDAFVAAQVGQIIGALEGDVGGRDAAVLRKLYTLYLLAALEGGLVDVLSFGLLGHGTTETDPTRSLRVAIKRACEELLPEAIGLSDGFGFSDWELDSALGVYDGNAYETLWKKAQMEPLNTKEVTEGYEHHIKPMLQRGQKLAAHVKL